MSVKLTPTYLFVREEPGVRDPGHVALQQEAADACEAAVVAFRKRDRELLSQYDMDSESGAAAYRDAKGSLYKDVARDLLSVTKAIENLEDTIEAKEDHLFGPHFPISSAVTTEEWKRGRTMIQDHLRSLDDSDRIDFWRAAVERGDLQVVSAVQQFPPALGLIDADTVREGLERLVELHYPEEHDSLEQARAVRAAINENLQRAISYLAVPERPVEVAA